MQEAHLKDVGTFEDEIWNEYQGTADRETYAAMLRALADEVGPHQGFPEEGNDIQKGIWLAQDHIRDRLLDAADEAEVGE